MQIIYVRHGEPIYHPDQLTPLGRRQAEAVARRIALFGIDEIYSSPSVRAMQTAEPLCELTGLEMKTLDFLNENDLDGMKAPVPGAADDFMWAHYECAPILASREVREMGDRWYEHPLLEKYHFERYVLPIGEQMDALLASHGYVHDTDKGLYKIVKRQPEKRIAIFAHECVGKIVMSHMLDIPFPYYAAHCEMHTSSFSIVRLDGGELSARSKEQFPYARARLLTLSNDAHLWRDGLPLSHRFTHIRDRY